MTIKQRFIETKTPFPNNPRLALTIYEGALGNGARPENFEELFGKNGWANSWRNGIYPFHHFHSTAHEVLGCYQGSCSAQFGGPEGPVLRLNRGDALLIPAGVGHKLRESSPDFHVVGAYPDGTFPDLCRGELEEFDRLLARVLALAPPPHPPVD